MSDPFNRPPQKSPDEWAELEKNPRFQRLLVQNLQIALVDKKFGPNIIDAHRNLMLRREFENEEGKADGEDFIS